MPSTAMRAYFLAPIFSNYANDNENKYKHQENPARRLPANVCSLNCSPEQGINAIQMMEGSLNVINYEYILMKYYFCSVYTNIRNPNS